MNEFEYLEKSKNEIITIDSLNKKKRLLYSLSFFRRRKRKYCFRFYKRSND